MNKKNLILCFAVVVVIILGIYTYTGVQKKESSISLNFSYEPTNQAFFCEFGSPKIRGSNWIENNILEVKVQENVNCDHEVAGGDYEIEGNKIILYYEVIGGGIADCAACINMTYQFTGLEQKDYEFELRSK